MKASGGMGGSRRILILAVVAVFLLGQYALIRFRGEEHYPAIILPGFGSVATAEGTYAVNPLTITVEYEDGMVLTPTPDELLSDFRFSAASPSLSRLFQPSGDVAKPQPSRAVVAWLRKDAEELANGSVPTRITFCWRPSVIDLASGRMTPVGECSGSTVEL